MLEVSKEIWVKSIYDGYYVSNMGRVKNRVGKILSKRICQSNGYYYVSLRINGINKEQKVSRLVALSFLDNPENKSDVDHINTIKTDDRLENLRWATRSENMRNPLTRAKILNKPFQRHPKRMKPILQFSKDGVFIKEWDSATIFGESIGKEVSGNIIACIKGKQNTAYGYKWKYKNSNKNA